MSELTTTAVAGAAAGLGVAVPVGAIGVLLVQESMRGPRRAAHAAAAAVAVVDMAYAGLATAVGPLVAQALGGVEAWVRLLSAVILLTLAGTGLYRSRGPGPVVAEDASAAGAGDARAGGPAGGDTASGGAVRAFLRFAALTAVNPTTALYFAALTTAQGASLAGGPAAVVFTGAVLLASLVWQQLLVTAGSFAGARISARARAWTFRAGYGLVAVYAVKIALPLP
ncbi:LysE family transporter [Streptomyces sp. NPDC097619]|uniref:LysE family transporter n=1 Tax=Streptomyces sp. NPDC097619 TaxID=3157228 RepID=UPI00332CF79B